MPKLSDTAKKNKAQYDIAYQRENVTRKFIPFNKNVPEEKEMLDWLDEKGKGKVAGYVKDLIREDMRRSGR